MDVNNDGQSRASTPWFSPNSPPFNPGDWPPRFPTEEQLACENQYDRADISSPVAPLSSDDNSDISDMEDLPCVDDNEGLDANDMNNDMEFELYIPRNREETQTLIHQFRKEILRDWVSDDRAQIGLHEPFDPHQLDMANLGRALLSKNELGNKTFITQSNIMRHDWNRLHDCIYTVTVSGR